MAIIADYSITRLEDTVLTINLSPPTAVGGWSVQFTVQKRFGGVSGLIVHSCASGFGNGVSGIKVTNSGTGVFSISLNSLNTSGLDAGNYSMQFERLDSGFRSMLVQGYLILLPSQEG